MPFTFKNLESMTSAEANGRLPAGLVNLIKTADYHTLEEALIIHLDSLDNIKTSVIHSNDFPTGVGFERDATQSLPLSQRLDPDDIRIVADNLLLRALATLRSIDYMLQQPSFQEMQNVKDLREILQTVYLQLFRHVNDETDPTKLNKYHEDFNTQLFSILEKANLLQGLNKDTQFEKLLLHYRNLASLLEPAKSMRTVTQDAKFLNGQEVRLTFTETAHPITRKTAEQIKQIELMKQISDSKSEEPNFHNTKHIAFQIANTVFADLLKDNKRRLPSQTRKTIGPTIKNGYMVNNAVTITNNRGTEEHHDYWTMRCASPAYVGSGESNRHITQYTNENVAQLQEAAATLPQKQRLHLLILVTNSRLEEQNIVYKYTTQAAATLGNCSHSYVPLNKEGTFTRGIDLAAPLKQYSNALTQTNIFKLWEWEKTRALNAGEIINLATQLPNTINVSFCNSGQDRTSNAEIVSRLLWMTDIYNKHFIDVKPKDIEDLIVRSGHNVLLATLAAPGSLGLKKGSQPGNFFSSEANKYLYRTTAKTNKSTPVAKMNWDDMATRERNKTTAPLPAFFRHHNQKIQDEAIMLINNNTHDLPFTLKHIMESIGTRFETRKTKEFNNPFYATQEATQLITVLKNFNQVDDSNPNALDQVTTLLNQTQELLKSLPSEISEVKLLQSIIKTAQREIDTAQMIVPVQKRD